METLHHSSTVSLFMAIAPEDKIPTATSIGTFGIFILCVFSMKLGLPAQGSLLVWIEEREMLGEGTGTL